METVEYMWVNIWCMLISPAKIPECKGNISPSSFYSNCQTISHTFYNPIYPVDGRNKVVGLV